MRRMLIAAGLIFGSIAFGQVKFDSGRYEIMGVQLLQDYQDDSAFYYLPKYPRLATNEDGTLEFLCLKYVDPKGQASGGLFHCLVEFTLPPETVLLLEKELQKKHQGARIVGPVALLPAKKEAEDQPGSFEVVSAVLNDKAPGGMTRTVITSGSAPLTPGSKAAVAAILNPNGATLLWNSLSGPTSDVSISINAYYEAVVTAFNARVTCDVSTVYKHFSSIYNSQHDYTKRQIRQITDDLQRTGDLKVESLDRGAGLGIKTDDMAKLLDLITSKLTELMFDTKTGFAADPEREAAVEQGQLLGRKERSWLSRTFGGTDDTKYYTDDQWVIKDRKDIKHNLFTINLSKNGTVKVPVSTAGNIHGLYDALKDDPRYFRIVNMDDPAFQTRTIHFQVDGDFVDSFADTINFVAVNLRKKYKSGQSDVTAAIRFDPDTVKKGTTVQGITYPRLAESGKDMMDYEYQVVWSIHDRPSIKVPAGEAWTSTQDPAVSLVPPFEKVQIEIDADRQNFKDKSAQTCVVEFKYPLVGKSQTARRATLRQATRNQRQRHPCIATGQGQRRSTGRPGSTRAACRSRAIG